MPTYIALLRGINVSGQKKIKMADLRDLLNALPFQNIRTYIQSGNIVFESELTDLTKMATLIREAIQVHYGFDVPTLVMPPSRIEKALQNNPFEADPEIPQERVYLTYLAAAPTAENRQSLEALDFSPERFVLSDQTVYLYSPQGYGRSKLSNNLFERKLKVDATTRNWRTSQKLVDMAN